MDHRPGVIQSGRPAVDRGMSALQLAPRCARPPAALAVTLGPAVERVDRMAKDDKRAAGVDFSRLIDAVAANRDRAAFTTLFDHFAPRLKTYLMRGGADAARADELAQETLLTVWRKAESFDATRATAATWIFTIARNLRIDKFRKEWRDVSVGSEIPDTVDESAKPDATLSDVERGERVRAALRQLSPEQIKVIELSFFEDKPHVEIAKALGVPLGTVKSRIRIAMNRLRDLVSDLS
jgi:RNA polymerase sigma-70 factor (ECF subfamily)